MPFTTRSIITICFALSPITNVFAASILHPRQSPDCNSPGGIRGIDPSCWNTLGMTAYTQNWWKAHQASCGSIPFSTCFLDTLKLGTHDCTGVKPGACPAPDPNANNITARDFYILYNIYAINQVFNSLYLAIGNANTLASETVGAIVTLLDPPQATNIALSDVLTALGAGLGLISGLEGIAGLILRVSNQIPGIAKYLFPVGTTQDQVNQWASISNQVGTVVQQFQGSVSQIIPTINNDVTNFIAFASTGGFSVTPLPDLSNESNALLKGLTTFIVGKALESSNIHIGRAVDTDVNALQLNSSDTISYDTGCGKGYDAAGICGPFWFDHKNAVTYSLNNYNHMPTNYHNVMETLFANWTTGDLLFGGAARCAAQGGPKGSLAQTVLGANGQVTIDCLSSAKICTWDVNSLYVDHEFTDCPSQPGYVANGCSGTCGNSDGATASVNVPNGYLGAYLLGSNMACVCNT